MINLLCFRAFDTLYGLPLDMVEETFDEQRVTPLPCLNHLFTGLCNHNGIIYPVLSFSHLVNQDIPDTRCCMLLINVEGTKIILRMNDIPFILYEKDMDRNVPYDGGSGTLKLNRIIQKDDHTIYQVDMKQILEYLSEHLIEQNQS